MSRRVVHFSCGAASAVAAMITCAKYPDAIVVNAFLAEEHEDNQRFLNDVEAHLGRKVIRLRDVKYSASAYEVFRRERFISSQNGAPCSFRLKGMLLSSVRLPGDVIVFGYTDDRRDRGRAETMRENLLDEGVESEFPLIESGISKAMTLAIIDRLGIKLPEMYRLGYNNANCIGCPKGGKGYWNKIRREFPERFEEMAKIQDELGPGSHFLQNKDRTERVSLRNLNPDEGRHDETLPECGFVCERFLQEMET